MIPNNETHPVKLIIVEDQKEVREGLQYLFGLDSRIQVLKTYDRGEPLLASLPTLVMPDVILIDIGLPGMNGIEIIRILKQSFPALVVIVFTVFEDQKNLLEAIHAGANGYILKNTRPELLLDQILSAVSGGSPLSPQVASQLLEEIKRQPWDNGLEQDLVTKREKEILHCLVEGMTYREIAEQFCISPATVKKHILHLYKKLGVRSRTTLIRKVLREERNT